VRLRADILQFAVSKLPAAVNKNGDYKISLQHENSSTFLLTMWVSSRLYVNTVLYYEFRREVAFLVFSPTISLGASTNPFSRRNYIVR
jgi:hypothetical protein